MDPMTLYAIGTVGVSLFNTGFSYFQEQRKLNYQQKEKKIQLQTEMESLIQDQERFQARSGLKSPYAKKVITEGYKKALERIK